MSETSPHSSSASAAPAQTEQKRVHIKSFGCQMNVYDATRMADVLAPQGYTETDSVEEADLVILNTCHIREKAAEKVYSELGRLRVIKNERAEQGRETRIAVAGCVAQAEGAEIVRRAPVVDIVVGPQSYHRFPDLLSEAVGRKKAIDTEFPEEDKFDHLPQPSRSTILSRGYSSFLTVQEGCDKFCTFCVVPYTRGAEVSRPVARIVAEAEQLAAAGVREITLIGQNVNAYHGLGEDGAEWGLARLARRIAAVPGIDRLRYSTSHPAEMSDELVFLHRDMAEFMPYLHLPVQSGSDRILAAMNRKHTGDDYRRIIASVRAARPDIALSSDFIVGFPGETDADFEDTLRLVGDIGFASAFSFKYSARPGTPAAGMDGQVPEEVKSERLHRLQDLLTRQQKAFNQTTVGRTLDVLFEKPGRHPGQVAGKSPYLQAVQVDGPDSLIGRIVPVTITGLATFSLFGTLAETAAPEGDS